MVNESLQFYVDTMIMETILTDPRLKKEAQGGIVSSLIQKVFGYFHDKFNEVKDSDHKVAMVANFLVPGVLTAFGFPVLGFLVKVSQMLFHFDFAKIFGEIASSIKNLITGGKQTSSETVDNVVNTAVTSSLPPEPTEETVTQFIGTQASFTLREAQLFKVALVDYLDKNPDVNLIDPEVNIKFAAGLFGSALATFIGSRHKTTKILISVIGWIVKAVLAAGGFMLMGDVVSKMFGSHTSGIDGQPTGPSANENASFTPAPPPVNLQVNPSYTEESYNGPMSRWIIQNDVSSVDNLLISWADEIYPAVKGQEQAIRSARTFNLTVTVIKAYNKGSPPNTIFMPKQWKSRKDVVDQFMGEVALHMNLGSTAPGAIPGSGMSGVRPIPNYTPVPQQNQGTLINYK